MPKIPAPTSVNDILRDRDEWQVRARRQRIEYLHERLKKGERFMEVEIESMIDLLMQNYSLHAQLDGAIRQLQAGADLYWSMTVGKGPLEHAPLERDAVCKCDPKSTAPNLSCPVHGASVDKR